MSSEIHIYNTSLALHVPACRAFLEHGVYAIMDENTNRCHNCKYWTNALKVRNIPARYCSYEVTVSAPEWATEVPDDSIFRIRLPEHGTSCAVWEQGNNECI